MHAPASVDTASPGLRTPADKTGHLPTEYQNFEYRGGLCCYLGYSCKEVFESVPSQKNSLLVFYRQNYTLCSKQSVSPDHRTATIMSEIYTPNSCVVASIYWH